VTPPGRMDLSSPTPVACPARGGVGPPSPCLPGHPGGLGRVAPIWSCGCRSWSPPSRPVTEVRAGAAGRGGRDRGHPGTRRLCRASSDSGARTTWTTRVSSRDRGGGGDTGRSALKGIGVNDGAPSTPPGRGGRAMGGHRGGAPRGRPSPVFLRRWHEMTKRQK